MPFITTTRRHRDLLQGLGSEGRPADRLPSRLAALRRRLGQPDDVLPGRGLSASSRTTGAVTAARPRPTPATRWTPMRPTSLELAAAARSQGRGPYRPLDRRRRSRRTMSPARKPGRVAKAVLIGAVPPVMVKSDAEPRRPADRGVRRLPQPARGQPRAVLLDVAERPVLRLQPPRRQGRRRA